MKKEGLKTSFDQIKPDEVTKKRMLSNILNYSDRKKENSMALFFSKKAIPALALTVVIATGFITYSVLSGRFNYNTPPGYIGTDSAEHGREDAVAPLLNQFQIDNKHYIVLSDDLRADFGLPATVNEADIGDKITVITKGPDKSLIGSEVYSYIPAGGEAIVAVKTGDEYKLFRFFTFESYNNNQDEDAIEYLKLYGIYKPDDIARIQFIGHSEESKLQGRMDILGEIADRDEINKFYDFYSALRNSSEKYFDKLFNYSSTGQGSKEVETDPFAGMMDMGNAGAGSDSVEPSRGAAGDALANPVTVRIYNQNGIYFDSMYYKNIGFISRYEVSQDFADFMGKYLNR